MKLLLVVALIVLILYVESSSFVDKVRLAWLRKKLAMADDWQVEHEITDEEEQNFKWKMYWLAKQGADRICIGCVETCENPHLAAKVQCGLTCDDVCYGKNKVGVKLQA
jgi:hypothetical protein